MKKLLIAAAIAAAFGIAHAQQPIKIGLVLSSSGQFADAGAQLDNGIKTYMKMHGDTVAGRKIELIRRDTGGIAPDAPGEAHDALGHQVGMLDDVARVGDHAGDQLLSFRQLQRFP